MKKGTTKVVPFCVYYDQVFIAIGYVYDSITLRLSRTLY